MLGIYDRIFKATHGSRLIYNTCWEDPAADREMLKLAPDSKVAMITSAGCNALDYLLDNPQAIHSIDVNSRQNALLELKIAAISELKHDEFFQLFGLGAHRNFRALYMAQLRPRLSASAQLFWDANAHYFSTTGGRGSLYFQGASGDVAWGVGSSLKILRPKLHRALLELLDSETLALQCQRYEAIEPKIFGPMLRWLVRQPMLLSLLGVPRAQRDLIERQFPGGVTSYVRAKLRYVFTQTNLRNNYFWRVYLTGQYSENCCPNYLKAEHFETLKARVARISIHTGTFEEFLVSCPDAITHFVLLDHQDWMAAHLPIALNSEWRYILARSAPGAKVLLRSAGLAVDFLPEFVAANLVQDQPLAKHWHELDRVGTYGCTWLAELRPCAPQNFSNLPIDAELAVAA